jgi:hypothetical protein
LKNLNVFAFDHNEQLKNPFDIEHQIQHFGCKLMNSKHTGQKRKTCMQTTQWKKLT